MLAGLVMTHPIGLGAQLVSAEAFKGQVVYLDFWASWCTPCKASFPFMNDLHEQLASKGLVVLAVNLDEQRAAADRFLAQTPAKFRIAYDPKGVTPEHYTVKAMPTAVLIDRKGQVRHVHAGFREADKNGLRVQVEALLKEAP